MKSGYVPLRLSLQPTCLEQATVPIPPFVRIRSSSLTEPIRTRSRGSAYQPFWNISEANHAVGYAMRERTSRFTRCRVESRAQPLLWRRASRCEKVRTGSTLAERKPCQPRGPAEQSCSDFDIVNGFGPLSTLSVQHTSLSLEP